MSARQGYSLTEVMVGVVVVGLLAVATVPNIGSYLRSQGAASGAEQLSAHMRLARSRAILEGNDYVVQFLEGSRYVILDDDGGGDGVPGSADYDAANRSNGVADDGERVMGPFELPGDLVFAAADGATNPFTLQEISAAVTFPTRDGVPTVVFRANGTSDSNGFVTLAPQADLDRGSSARCYVLQLLSATGSVASRAAGSGS